MTVIRDVARGVFSRLEHCRDCDSEIYHGYSQRGRRVAFNVQDGQASRDVHDEMACLVARELRKAAL